MLSIFLVGIALSMDAFSLALSIGLNNISSSKKVILPIMVGIMHFIMPALGLLLGNEIFKIFNLNIKIIVSIVFLYLAYLMYKEKNNNKSSIITNFFSLFLFSFSVSIDSFSVGLCLQGLTNHYILSFIVFSLCSSTITYLGLLIGNYSIKYLKDKAIILAIIILSFISVVNICQVLWH